MAQISARQNLLKLIPFGHSLLKCLICKIRECKVWDTTEMNKCYIYFTFSSSLLYNDDLLHPQGRRPAAYMSPIDWWTVCTPIRQNHCQRALRTACVRHLTNRTIPQDTLRKSYSSLVTVLQIWTGVVRRSRGCREQPCKVLFLWGKHHYLRVAGNRTGYVKSPRKAYQIRSRYKWVLTFGNIWNINYPWLLLKYKPYHINRWITGNFCIYLM